MSILEEESDPYDQGWAAGYDDLLPDNPYPEGSEEHDLWNEGYTQGSLDC